MENKQVVYNKKRNHVPSLLEICFDWIEFNFSLIPIVSPLDGCIVELLLPELMKRRKRGSTTLNEDNIQYFFSSQLDNLELENFWYEICISLFFPFIHCLCNIFFSIILSFFLLHNLPIDI